MGKLGGKLGAVALLLLLLLLLVFSGPGDGVEGGFSLCGDSGNWLESSSMDETLPCAWLW